MEKNVITLHGLNVLGGPLKACCHQPKTGYYRDGFCRVGEDDSGNHSVCAIMNDEFLEFSMARGNDLMTPKPEFGFPGLKAGDKWCLCAGRWQEGFEAGVAPPVVLESCSLAALEDVRLEDLQAHSIQ